MVYSILITKLYLLTCIYSLIFSHALVFIRLFFLMLSHLLMHLNLLMHVFTQAFVYTHALVFTHMHFFTCIHLLVCTNSRAFPRLYSLVAVQPVITWRVGRGAHSRHLGPTLSRAALGLAFRIWAEVIPRAFVEDLTSGPQMVDVLVGFGAGAFIC